jgi:DNA topoisomerase-1
VPRLRKVSSRDPGWSRRRCGRGFTYLDRDGNRITGEDRERIQALAIPPAWEDVWICPVPNGHLQAVGTDAAGRRQYLYHPVWRARQDEKKFDRVARAARRLPHARRTVSAHLGDRTLSRNRACATAVRLLDLGCFRIGGDSDLESFGLTTLERRHLRCRGHTLVFSFAGKSEIEQQIEIEDAAASRALLDMRRRRGAGRLLAWRDGRLWVELAAEDVNDYLAELTGEEFTAKDFRTWHATVLAAVSLATTDEPGDSRESRRRAVKGALAEVAELLGNTPTIARNSYVDPRVIELYEDGATIAPTSDLRTMTGRAATERAVLNLLSRA